MANPLVLFDTNVVIDLWLGRDGDQAALLVGLAEKGKIDLVIPEFVLLEFQGTALRWVADQRRRVDEVRQPVNEWKRTTPLGSGSDTLRRGLEEIVKELDGCRANIEKVDQRLRAVATVPGHTPDLHFRGDLRYLRGLPPDRPVDGLKDCRIYEALLDVLKGDRSTPRPCRVFATKDRDFAKWNVLVEELRTFDTEIRADLGAVFGELK